MSEPDFIVPEGWHSADDMPDDPDATRIVQIMWDDGSTGPDALAFADEVWQDPPTGVRVWWSYQKLNILDYSVCAWRDIERKARNE